MKPNKPTINLVKEFEGLEHEAYYDPVGVLTIGYGYTNKAGFGPGVKEGDLWTETKAAEMLALGLEKFGHTILPMMTRKPTPNQYGAMLSLAYNIGAEAFSKSTCLKRFNAGDIEGAAEALQWFNKAGGKKLRGLVRRREAERNLFLSDGPAPDAFMPGGCTTPDPEKTAATSTTMIAATGTALSGAGGVATAIGSLDGAAQIVVIVLAFAALVCIAWIMRERIKKLGEGI